MPQLIVPFVGGWPKTKGSVDPRGGNPEYQTRESRMWAQRVATELRVAIIRCEWVKVESGPVSARLLYWLPLDDVTAAGAGQGDIDKLERCILDAATDAGVYHDDRQVVSCTHEKWPHVPERRVFPGVRIQFFAGRV